jgi:molybdopterin adenylyltransferase
VSSTEHKKNAPSELTIGLLTISTTRTAEDDKAGLWIKKRIAKEGHKTVLYKVIPDDREIIKKTVLDALINISPDVLLITGGTGISEKDVTIEAVRPIFKKELTAFGPIFSQLSFEEIDSAALLSRATAGIAMDTVIFCMPGSMNACKLACKALIFPELGHLIRHIKE